MTYNHIGPAEIGPEGQTRALLSALCRRICEQRLAQQLNFEVNLDFGLKRDPTELHQNVKLHLSASESALSCTRPNLK